MARHQLCIIIIIILSDYTIFSLITLTSLWLH